MVSLAVAYVLQGRRLLALERDLRRALQFLSSQAKAAVQAPQNHGATEGGTNAASAMKSSESSSVNSSVNSTANFSVPNESSGSLSINTPLGSSISTLSERKASEMRVDEVTHSIALSQSSKYAFARRLLMEGQPVHVVAQKSGLSEAELSLLGKISSSTNKNNRMH